MIRLYEANETAFKHNRFVLQPYSATVTEQGNGDFSAVLSCPIDYSIIIRPGNIITLPTPRGEQPFRVYSTQKTFSQFKIKARHITYDTANNFLFDVRPTSVNGQAALTRIEEGRSYFSPVRLSSNIPQTATAYYVRKTELEALIGAENSFLNVWGGYLIRDGWEMNFRDNPRDLGYRVELGYNLTGVDAMEDNTEVITSLMPTFVLEDNLVYKLPEITIRSPLADVYPMDIVRELRVDLTDEQKKQTPESLYPYIREQVKKAFDSGLDKPKLSYRVEFVQVSKTEAYKNLQLLEQLDIFDEVTCKIQHLGIDVKLIMIAYSYDAIKDQYISMTLGELRPTGASTSKRMQRTLEDQITKEDSPMMLKINAAQKDIVASVTGAKGGHIRINLNADGTPQEILIMDTADSASAKYVVRLNKNGIGISKNGIEGPYDIAMDAEHGVFASALYSLKITSAMIESGAITSEKIAAWAVNTGNIAAGAITADKLRARELFSLNGTFTGTVHAQDGEFKGTINANHGTFGSLTVNSGQTDGTYFGSLKNVGGSVLNLGGVVKSLGGSITNMAGSLNKTTGIHAGGTTGNHTGSVNSTSIKGTLNGTTGSARLTNSALSGSFDGDARTNNSSSIGGALNQTAGTHCGSLQCQSGTIGGQNFYNSSGSLWLNSLSCQQIYTSNNVMAANVIARDLVQSKKVQAEYIKATYPVIVGSDVRLKEELRKIGLDLIKELFQLPIYSFKYKDSDYRSIGINATELEQKENSKLKEIVLHKDRNGFLSADYMSLASLGLAAIQNLDQRLKELEEKK